MLISRLDLVLCAASWNLIRGPWSLFLRNSSVVTDNRKTFIVSHLSSIAKIHSLSLTIFIEFILTPTNGNMFIYIKKETTKMLMKVSFLFVSILWFLRIAPAETILEFEGGDSFTTPPALNNFVEGGACNPCNDG